MYTAPKKINLHSKINTKRPKESATFIDLENIFFDNFPPFKSQEIITQKNRVCMRKTGYTPKSVIFIFLQDEKTKMYEYFLI